MVVIEWTKRRCALVHSQGLLMAWIEWKLPVPSVARQRVGDGCLAPRRRRWGPRQHATVDQVPAMQ
jgi:hypothetical protein